MVVVGHALRNLTEGVGGPRDADLLHTEAGYREGSQALVVEQLGEVVRHLPGGDAIDFVLVARRARVSRSSHGRDRDEQRQRLSLSP